MWYCGKIVELEPGKTYGIVESVSTKKMFTVKGCHQIVIKKSGHRYLKPVDTQPMIAVGDEIYYEEKCASSRPVNQWVTKEEYLRVFSSTDKPNQETSEKKDSPPAIFYGKYEHLPYKKDPGYSTGKRYR